MPSPTRRQVLLGGGATAGLGGLAYFGLTGNAPPLRQYGSGAAAETAKWLDVVRDRGRDGDWLAIRGYHPADHLVAGATLKKFSHAAVLDHGAEEVIEAVAPRVRVVGLAEFLSNCHRFELIRPHEATEARGRDALARARSKVGVPYDFLGTIGLPSEQRSYCSELCAWAWSLEVDRKGPWRVVHPSAMKELGESLYDSGPRKLSAPTT